MNGSINVNTVQPYNLMYGMELKMVRNMEWSTIKN